jgi:hypothetical protein
VLGRIWDIAQVPARNFDWLPFTPFGRLLRSFNLYLLISNLFSMIVFVQQEEFIKHQELEVEVNFGFIKKGKFQCQ